MLAWPNPAWTSEFMIVITVLDDTGRALCECGVVVDCYMNERRGTMLQK